MDRTRPGRDEMKSTEKKGRKVVILLIKKKKKIPWVLLIHSPNLGIQTLHRSICLGITRKCADLTSVLQNGRMDSQRSELPSLVLCYERWDEGWSQSHVVNNMEMKNRLFIHRLLVNYCCPHLEGSHLNDYTEWLLLLVLLQKERIWDI